MGYLFQRMPTSYLPDEDQGILLVQTMLPSGSTLDQTEKVMDKAAITPDEEIGTTGLSKEEEEKLSVFRDFVDSLDLDDLDQEQS